MKKILLETSFSKIYMIVMIIITLLILGSYFSYAMFTVTKEKSNAISIVTGNLTYKLEADGEESNTLTVEPNSSKEFIITLSNPNNRIARFNFYYIGDLPNNVEAGYLNEEGINIPPVETGMNLEKIDTVGSSNTYKIKVNNTSSNSVTIKLGVSVGLDYNNLVLPSDGHLFKEYEGIELYKVLLKDSKNNINTSDSEQIFITGENPNNYIWYSGKLWRAVSIDPSDNSVKLVTQWNISAIPYDDNSSTFKGSHMEMWLNDTSVDGFLGNLREPEKFIKMDSKWNATMTTNTSKPSKTTIVEAPVGLLNMYEYVMSYRGTTASKGYLSNGLQWYILNPYNATDVNIISNLGDSIHYQPIYGYGVRPSINLNYNITVSSGIGTEENPYRLKGDDDKNLNGTLLSSRYSGEYIRFGIGENNLYRIVSHETEELTKITSTKPLKDSGVFKTMAFGSNTTFSTSNTIGSFLNREYLTNYLGTEYSNMIEESTTWYLGTIALGQNYRLAKYKDVNMNLLTTSTTNTKIGLLRVGELMSGQFERFSKLGENTITGLTTDYWTLTPYNSTNVNKIYVSGQMVSSNINEIKGIKPSMNLKSNVVITGGTGLKNNPFTLELQ